MTYNVFGGTLNLAQLHIVDLSCEHLQQCYLHGFFLLRDLSLLTAYFSASKKFPAYIKYINVRLLEKKLTDLIRRVM